MKSLSALLNRPLSRFADILLGNALLQLLALLFSAMMLDGGILVRATVIGIAAWWCGVLWIALRRQRRQDKDLLKSDLIFLKVGWPFCILAVPFADGLISTLR